MKKASLIAFLLALALPCLGQEEERRFAGLDSLLTQFYAILEREDIEVKTAEMDALIGSCADSLARQHVALSIFDHYKESRLMGEEEVAIHVYDRWFADNSVPMKGDFDKLNAQMFADFNRHTLIGMDAPEIILYKPNGKERPVPEKGRSSIFYFHDTNCSKCKLTDRMMPGVLGSIDFDCTLYAVYYGSDPKAFRKFRKEFKVRNRKVKVIHLWDPEMRSNYQILYGVLSTPKLYMAAPDGTIIGRRLELDSLRELIPYAAAIQSAYNGDLTDSNCTEQIGNDNN